MMSPVIILELLKEVIFLTLVLGAPILIVTLVVGVAISILQAVTQIQEATLTFVPKILAALATFIICAPWMIELFMGRTTTLIHRIPELIQ